MFSTRETIGSGLGFKNKTRSGFKPGTGFSKTHPEPRLGPRLKPEPDPIKTKIAKNHAHTHTLITYSNPNSPLTSFSLVSATYPPTITHTSHCQPLSSHLTVSSVDLKLMPHRFVYQPQALSRLSHYLTTTFCDFFFFFHFVHHFFFFVCVYDFYVCVCAFYFEKENHKSETFVFAFVLGFVFMFVFFILKGKIYNFCICEICVYVCITNLGFEFVFVILKGKI